MEQKVMEKKTSKEVTEHSPVVDNGEPVEVQAIGKFFQGIIEPIVKTQEIVAKEGTKQAEIMANIAHKGLFYFFAVAFVILAISIVALYLGKDQLAEKIIFGVITFIGGLGIGRSMPKNG
ncbi:MAG: hypothetical protein OQJ89_06780 [Kangiellaceae bacterium]|nr:hypothetical protein [Kangiellaceae bacterium]MCW9000367.1 hypothetical protein [Kangiellaceae bacterium]MCW9016648.1 hypothetical protein [Kangiellaceae bacterium]